MQSIVFWFAVLLAIPALAAERVFNWNEFPPDQPPAGFRSTLSGVGRLGEWKVIPDDSPRGEPSGPTAASPTNRVVLAQLSRVAIGNHFPLLIFEPETFRDFRMTTRFKIAGGALEQMAGIVFRFQNESNFYVVAANASAGALRCYKLDAGQWKPPFGAEVEITRGTWHELAVQCEGTRIVCSLDGKDLIKLVDSLSAGKQGRVGFWTKSDSVGFFGEARITYQPRLILAQVLVRDALKEYGRLVDLQIFAVRPGSREACVVAAKDEKTLGQSGGKTEQAVLSEAVPYYARGRDTATVTIPLQDRNGEPIAAVRVVLKAVPGQTQENAVMRAMPVAKLMQARARSLEELLQ